MFGPQAIRMLRETWRSPTELAEELFALFSQPDTPLRHAGPITLQKGTGEQPAIIFRGFAPGDTVFTIERGPDAPPVEFTADDVVNNVAPDQEEDPDQPKQPSQNNAFAGRVLSGTGSTYRVALASDEEVTARQMQIDEEETIPEGTYTLLVKEGETYFMQVPVWL